MYLIFDTETTGLPRNYAAPLSDTDNWPRCVQIAWQLHDAMGNLIEHQDYIIYPEGYNIPYDAERIHGISTELAQQQGQPLQEVLQKFNTALAQAKFIVGQNVGFDVNIVGSEFYRLSRDTPMTTMPVLDTCTEVTAQLLKLPGGKGGKYKLPTLTELHEYLFGEKFEEAHNATADVEATTRCFLELVKREVFTQEELDVDEYYFKEFNRNNPKEIQLIGLKHINLKQASEAVRKVLQEQEQKEGLKDGSVNTNIDLTTVDFVHLHNHTQFSVLQSTISVSGLVQAAIKNKMPAVAMTDIGNMMGVFHFVRDVLNHNKSSEEKIKPIVGCEFYVCDNHKDRTRKDNGYQIVLLAKNKEGYHNLAKLASIAYTEGFYYVPRIDKELIKKHKSNLIVLSGSLYGEIPNKILNIGENQAEEALLWWKNEFETDFYIELMRHNQEDEDRVNTSLISLAKKHQVKTIATNNVFYLNKEDANAHDILLCVRDGEKQSTPIGRGRGYRFGLPNQEYYFKSSQEMKELFQDLPDAIINIQEVVDKIEPFDLSRDVLLPKFDIPQEFLVEEDNLDGGKRGENNYLKHLTYEGAKKRYQQITPEIEERIAFELQTIEKTGYPGYFLIVQDFIAEARKLGVSVGPGRGSAAGSVVAYCLWITNIDPLQYDLLFERFLNPDRVSMPDIDIDFDDEGRSKVMDYVIEKYGSNQVAQIITYGTMAAKSSLRDTARVLDLPLFEADKIAKLVPNLNLDKIFSMEDSALKQALRSEDFEKVKQLKLLANEGSLVSETISQAKILEGNLRNTGIHACGVIITPSDITNFVPVATAKDSELFVTQFDNSVVESAGLLKMDFLGLKTLTLIKDTCKLIKYRTGKELNPDEFPIDDVKTYELFQRGETVGIFQYESVGMQKYLRDLKPTVFGDLIAMNALYRPGPLEYIPSFVRRKNGDEAIVFDLPACQELLKETYGITVYQEQVMLLSQKLANFSKGDADVLRKAMGKKDRATLDKMKSKFITQAIANNHPENILEKIWKDWEAFAQYAFNKSHSTCYAWIGYQTAYLKAHYPAEYMAAVLSNNMNDIKSVSFFMEECKRMGLTVLGPDVNESFYKFTVNEQYQIRFGMGAIKGVGAPAVDTIVQNRKDGKYKSIFDLAKKIDLRAANKKAFESLALAGGFDGFANTHRAQYFHIEGEGVTFLEKAMRYGSKYQENQNSAQVSLFGDSSEVQIAEPVVPPCEEWSTMEKLSREREVVGIYISGHPLDDFKYTIQNYCSSFELLKTPQNVLGKTLLFGGIVTKTDHRTTKTNKGWGIFQIEGYDEHYEFRIFDKAYLDFRNILSINQFVLMKVTIKPGWIDQETGKPKEPRIEVTDVLQLQDSLEKLCKKLILKINIQELSQNNINQMAFLFSKNKGEHQVLFEILETQKVKLQIEPTLKNTETAPQDDEELLLEQPNANIDITEEEQIINQILMPSRKVKVKISNELLYELEKMQINFKLN